MTAEDAIQALKLINLTRVHPFYSWEEMMEVRDTAIEALEKQIPYKPKTEKLLVGVGRCKCGVEFLDKETKYCGNCGQKLDWSEEK